jgi:hypothetical protein
MKLRTLFALALLLTLSATLAFAQSKPQHHRVVIALTSGDEGDWDMTIGNIRNLLAQFPAGTAVIARCMRKLRSSAG